MLIRRRTGNLSYAPCNCLWYIVIQGIIEQCANEWVILFLHCNSCNHFTMCSKVISINCPGCWVHWLHPCRQERPTPNKCPAYDPKQSDGEVPVMPEHWGMRRENPFITIAPTSNLTRMDTTWWGHIYGSNRMKLCTHARRNCLK